MSDETVKSIRVVAGVLSENGKYLIAQRKPGGSNALEWEFPGGKTEPGETDARALERELNEELAIETRTGRFLREIDVRTDTRLLHIEYYKTELTGGTIRAVDCLDFEFVSPERFGEYKMSYADRLIADDIRGGLYDES